MTARILKLNKAGMPIKWIGLQEAAYLHCKNQILWSIGEKNDLSICGGINRITQQRSRIEFAPVIAVDGALHANAQHIPKLTNNMLFSRDHYLCLYCGEKFSSEILTRDHVIPQGQGGADTWENCVSACKKCNNRKGCRTPDEADMKLLAIPYRPNKYEYLALQNKRILADQMAFLKKGFSSNHFRIQ